MFKLLMFKLLVTELFSYNQAQIPRILVFILIISPEQTRKHSTLLQKHYVSYHAIFPYLYPPRETLLLSKKQKCFKTYSE